MYVRSTTPLLIPATVLNGWEQRVLPLQVQRPQRQVFRSLGCLSLAGAAH